MSDQTQNIHTVVATEGGQPIHEHRMRKGPVRVRKRKRDDATEGDFSARKKRGVTTSTGAIQAQPSIRLDLSEEAQEVISQAKAERLARRAARAEKRQERLAVRKAAQIDKNTIAPDATDEQKKAHLDELSATKLRREQRRAERAERRALRKERRAEKQLNTDKLSKLSNKEKLSGLFGNKKSSSSSTDNLGDNTATEKASNTQDATSKKQPDNIQAELNENNQQSKIGSETLGAGQVGQETSAVDRIADKLKKAKSTEKEPAPNKAKKRLENIFKKVKTNKTDDKKSKESAAAKPEPKKELSAEEAFMQALTTKLQDTGTKIDEFKTLELKATSERYKNHVETLQARAHTSPIRIVKEVSVSHTSIKTAAQNVGHIFSQGLSQKQTYSKTESQFPFSPNIQPLMNRR